MSKYPLIFSDFVSCRSYLICLKEGSYLKENPEAAVMTG